MILGIEFIGRRNADKAAYKIGACALPLRAV
jgi:hypothetical protein